MTFKKLPVNDKGDLNPYIPYLQSPRQLIIMSFRKSGKTLSMIDSPNFMIGDCEDGTDSFEGANKISLLSFAQDEKGSLKEFTKLQSGMILPTGLYQTVTEMREVNNMEEFTRIDKSFKDNPTEATYKALIDCVLKMPFPIFVVDTITSFMPIVEKTALFQYNSDMIDKSKQKSNIKRVDNYGGVQYIRKTLLELKQFVERSAPFIVYNAHTKLKKVVFEKTDEEMTTLDIDLEGQLPGIFSSGAAALGYLYRNEDGVFLDFGKKVESDLGARPRHLAERNIKIADIDERDKDGHLVKRGERHWQDVFPELNWSK